MNSNLAVSFPQKSSYKWYILTLATLTFTFVMAIPLMSLSVLFGEIAADLRLNLVQVGWIWSIGSLMGIIVGFVGGPLSDRIGSRWALTGAILLMAIFGTLRAWAWDFASLALIMLVMGFAQSAIPMNIHKTCGVWFGGSQLGMANGVVSVGMAFGFMLGSLLAATVLSPLLGGWRNVLIVYGVIALLFSLLWALSQEKATVVDVAQSPQARPSLLSALRHVVGLPNVWFLSLATLGVTACITGTLGYLPLFLRNIGWTNQAADGALATFHAVSMIAAIPIALLSDRLGRRKPILIVAALFVTIGIGLLIFAQGSLVWLAVILAGVARDGFMAVTMTTMMEVKGVGTRYAASAMGILIALMGIGNLLAPPLGNSLATIRPGAPFALWAGLAGLGLCSYFLFREEK